MRIGIDLGGTKMGIAYFETVPRTAHARAVREIEPSACIGMRSRMQSRRRTRAVSSRDMAYAGAGPWPPRNGRQ
jgi:hypothetical protein